MDERLYHEYPHQVAPKRNPRPLGR
jgi:hypothetical protein